MIIYSGAGAERLEKEFVSLRSKRHLLLRPVESLPVRTFPTMLLGEVLMDQASIAAVLGKLDSEVFVLTAADGDRRNGQIVCWVQPATIVPQVPRVLVGIGRLTYTRELIEASRRFALNLLGKDQWKWVPHFGFRSGRETDKFAEVPFESGVTGSPILPGIVGYVEAEVRSVLDGGAHLFYLADVLAGRLVADREPLRLSQLPALLPPEDLSTMIRLLEQDIVRDFGLLR